MQNDRRMANLMPKQSSLYIKKKKKMNGRKRKRKLLSAEFAKMPRMKNSKHQESCKKQIFYPLKTLS